MLVLTNLNLNMLIIRCFAQNVNSWMHDLTPFVKLMLIRNSLHALHGILLKSVLQHQKDVVIFIVILISQQVIILFYIEPQLFIEYSFLDSWAVLNIIHLTLVFFSWLFKIRSDALLLFVHYFLTMLLIVEYKFYVFHHRSLSYQRYIFIIPA